MLPVFVADMAEARQAAGIDARILVAWQVNDGIAPDLLDIFLFKEQLPPDVVFDVETTAGNGDVNMRMLIALPAVGVDRAEDTHFNTLLACPTEHGVGGAAEQVVEQGPVVVEERPAAYACGPIIISFAGFPSLRSDFCRSRIDSIFAPDMNTLERCKQWYKRNVLCICITACGHILRQDMNPP